MNTCNIQSPQKKSRIKKSACIVILLSVLCGSCVNRPAVQSDSSPVANSSPYVRDQLIPIDLERNDRVSFHDLFSEVKIIPLETSAQSLLTFPVGQPDKVIVNDGNYYLMDNKQQSIIIFGSDGKFLKKISKKGMGPGEYISIRDFNINRFNQNLEILSPEGRSVCIFDPSGDTFIEKITLPNDLPVVHYFQHLTPDTYVFLSYLGEIIFYSKKDSSVIRTNYEFPQWFLQSVFHFSHSPFYVYNDSVCFELPHNGDVFTISPENYQLDSRYCWDFGSHNFDLSVLPENKPINYYLDLSKKISMDYAVQFLIYTENSLFYMTRFKYKNRYKQLVFDKKTNEYLLFEKFKEGGDPLAQWMDEDAIYTFISPFYLNRVLNPSILNEENRLIYNEIKDEDNPVIIKYTFTNKR